MTEMDVFLAIMCVALACWHFDNAVSRYKEKRRREQKRKAALWQELG